MAGPKDLPDSFRISYSPDTDPNRPGCHPVHYSPNEHIELLRRIDKNLALMLDLLRDIAMGFA